MTHKKHWAVFINNQSNKEGFIEQVMAGSIDLPEGFEDLTGKKGALFSKLELDKFIEEEAIHDNKVLTTGTVQSLISFSSGERKKALFKYLMRREPDYLVLDNPFDNLDTESRQELSSNLQELSGDLNIIQVLSRREDLLPFVQNYALLLNSEMRWCDSETEVGQLLSDYQSTIHGVIPPPLESIAYEEEYIVQLREISVSYGDKAVLNQISWDISPGQFWQLSGKNGSGKTTILSMITGDNPKAYGKELFLFGRKKGSGESIWDIKKRIGYFTPSMIDRFRGYHSLENMLISGLLDSIGLYVIPSEAQKRLARQWLSLVNLDEKINTYFHDLTMGQQRLIMCIRAMIKHPPLMILDEPTAGLDDASANLVVDLVNKMASESSTTIIFVSHRKEKYLNADYVFHLESGPDGSIGRILH